MNPPCHWLRTSLAHRTEGLMAWCVEERHGVFTQLHCEAQNKIKQHQGVRLGMGIVIVCMLSRPQQKEANVWRTCESADMLCDATSFLCRDTRGAQGVEERRLAVI